MTQNFNSEDDYLEWWYQRNSERKDAYVTLGELEFFVSKDIFSPDPNLTNSSKQLLEAMPNKMPRSVLDIGTGCGLLAVHAAKRGASVFATDFDEKALEVCYQNAISHNVQGNVKMAKSYLFDSVEGSFDLIIANLPIVDSAWQGLSCTVENQMRRFFNKLPRHLKNEGSCLISFASFGAQDSFNAILMEQDLPWSKQKEDRFGIEWFVYTLRKD